MPASLSELANERSSYFITITMFDESGAIIDPMAIDAIAWTLTNAYGDVINELFQVEIEHPFHNPFQIILKGADLLIEGNADEIRHLTIEAVYDSIAATNLPFTDFVTFSVKNLVALQ